MRKVIFALLLLCLPLYASAQQERDFATQFMALYAHEDANLTCKTVSPEMMTEMLQTEMVKNDNDTKNIIRQIKTLQVIRSVDKDTAPLHYKNALNLATLNKKRFTLYAYGDKYQIYQRRKGNTIVELVHIYLNDDTFCITDLTGQMTKDFIKCLAE